MKKTLFIKNALILTASSLILRFVGIIFKVWLAALIGSEGIGLYQLIFSVYVLAATFATSGICTAVTRLVAEELALGSKKGTLKILRRAIELTLLIAAISVAAVYFGAEFIADRFIGDMRAVPALKILPLSLPFMGITSCLRGYFIARRKVTPNAVSQLFEQAVRILLVVVLVKKYCDKGLAACCGAVLFGDTAAELCACLMLGLIWLWDRKKLNSLSGRARPPFGIVRQILHISLPITSGRYLNTALRTAENILVPKNLAKYPHSGELALSQFGMIKGMALPILLFPSTLLNSISTLLIPEMSEAAAKGRTGLVKSATRNILKLTAVMSFIFAAVFFVGGREIGLLIYKSDEVGSLLRALSPIVPLMYLDSVSDGILKGLDQQAFSFRTAITDSTLRIILILILLPCFGLRGFIWIMYFSNLLTCALNVGRLLKVSKARLKLINEVILPLAAAFCITLLADTLLRLINGMNNFAYLLLICLISLPLYLIFIFLIGAVTADDVRGVFKR
ncbi:MAG: oligosaccharide flippase family protein [Acutalibacteraceae bacterium]